MTNPFYNPSGYPATRAPGTSLNARAEFLLIQAGFDKLPTLAGNGLKLLRVNAGGTAIETLDPATYMTAAQVAAAYLALAGGTMTGAVLGAVGAAATPGFAFAGRAGTGAWSPAADTLAFSSGGAERVRVNSAGYLLVGATASSGVGVNRFQLGKLADVTAGLLVQSTNSAASLYAGSLGDAYLVGRTGNTINIGHGPDDLNTFTARASINASGQFLIGTATVGIGGSGFTALSIGNGSASTFVSLKASGAQEGLWGADGTSGVFFGSFSNDILTLRTNNAERARIDTVGNLGIGVTPSVRLHAKSSGAIACFETTTARGSGNCYLTLRDATGDKGFIGYGGGTDELQIANYLNAALSFYTNSTPRFTLTSAGEAVLGVPGFNVQAERLMLPYDSTAGGAFINFANRGTGGGHANTYSVGGIRGTAYRDIYNAAYIAEISFQRVSQAGGLASSGDIYFKVSGNGDQLASSLVTALQIRGTDLALLDNNGYEFGYRAIPQLVKVANHVMVSSDRGRGLCMNTGNVEVPAGVFGGGDVVTVYNNSGGAMTIVQGAGMTLRFGTAGSGNRTLAHNGIATVYWINGSVSHISGSGLS
jgi:hypothetical protein